MNAQSLFVAIVTGLVAGWLAYFIMGGGGIISYVITGLIGSFVGTYLLGALKINLPISNPILAQIATATIGAILVIAFARLIA